jgi:uncharacterized membrane protein
VSASTVSEHRGAGPLRTRWERLNGAARVGGVDLARGLAVLGMFAAHLLWITEPFDFGDTSSWIAVADGRSSILFATLAGVSIGLVTGGATPLVGRAMHAARSRLAVRAGLLWVLGVVLVFTGVPVFVILPAYALLFLVALPLTALSARVLLPVAAALAVVMPVAQVLLDALPLWRTVAGNDIALLVGWHYPFTTWIAFVAAGLGAARAGITRLRVQVWLAGAGALLAAAAYATDAATGASEAVEEASFWGALWTARAHSTGLLEVIGSGGFALAILGLCLLACRTFLHAVSLPLRAVGAMPLTAYTAQLLVWAVAASAVLGHPGDLGGFRDLEPFWPFAVGTILFSTAWALLIGRGPLEAAVDRVSRWIVRDPAGPTAPGRLLG